MSKANRREPAALPPAIRAGGAVVWREDDDHAVGRHVEAPAPDANLLIGLVHRPRYDDWSLPKGKLHRSEYALQAAVREVGEELGSTVRVGPRLSSVDYQTKDGRKKVDYWAMRHLGGAHTASDEVDELCWLPLAEAAERLSYDLDRQVLADFATRPRHAAMLLLVRHAKAGKRSAFRGDDRLRPLDRIGRRQARDAAGFLSLFAPTRILAADRVRCEQTVAPTAAMLGLSVESAPELSDEGFVQRADRAVRRLRELGDDDQVSVVCSQGTAIPGLLAELGLAGNGHRPHPARKGSVWALSVDGGSVVSADYYPRPGQPRTVESPALAPR
ncbi:MAG: mutT1 [Frankiales bacterium]|nr:mutT1 [Frankiales bacterium]